MSRIRTRNDDSKISLILTAETTSGLRHFKDCASAFLPTCVVGDEPQQLLAQLTIPKCHGTNSLSPKLSNSLLDFSPEAVRKICSKISWPIC